MLSIVVVVFNMRREAPRTLETLRFDYQGIDPSLYEVIVVDNGPSCPLGSDLVASIDPQYRYFPYPADSPSPAAAINAAVREAKGQSIGLLIDGARMLSPGILRYSLLALRAYSRPLISTLGCHLGSMPQQQSVAQGYTRDQEDALLDSIDWRSDGYRLFDISCLAGSSKYGILAPLAESNALFMPRQLFEELGGFDEGFRTPGGGLANLDFYQRAQQLDGVQLVTLLGEATFHQVHGGVTTRPGETWAPLADEYRSLRGAEFDCYPLPWLRTDFLGQVREPFIPWLERACSQRQALYDTVSSDPHLHAPTPPLAARPDQQRVIAILGMHRSGTSLLAGCLQESGLVLGDVVTTAPHNRKGNRESLPIRALHDDLLERSGGAWDRPALAVSWQPIHRLLQQAVCESFAHQPCWGFKDPRSLFCLQGWIDQFPHLETVAIVRHPEEVASSLYARNRMPLSQGLELWYAYNVQLLHWMNQRSCPLILFSSDSGFFQEQALQLIRGLRLPRSSALNRLQFHDPSLRHQDSTGLELPQHVSHLYEQLIERVAIPGTMTSASPDLTSDVVHKRSWSQRVRHWLGRLSSPDH